MAKETGVAGCPQECPKSRKKYDLNRTKNCDECPKKKQFKIFKEETLERWQKWGIETAGFDQMLQTFYMIESFDDMPNEQITLKISAMRSIYRLEKAMADARRPQPILGAGPGSASR